MKSGENNRKSVVDYIQDLLFIIDNTGNILEVNEAVTFMTGFSKEKLVKSRIHNLFPAKYNNRIGNILSAGTSLNDETEVLPLKIQGGIEVASEIRFSSGLWNDMPVIIALGRFYNETKIKRWQSEQVFNTCQNLMAISTYDTGELIDVNPQFIASLGYTKEEIVGRTVREISLYEDHISRSEMLEQLNSDEYLENFETVYRTKTGEFIDVQVSLKVLNTFDNKFLLSSATDITKLKKSETHLKYLLRQQKFFADIAQLLNTPNNLEQTLDKVMNKLGEHTDVSRVYIFENSADGLTTSNTYEWCNKGIEPQISMLQEVPYEMIPSWKRILTTEGRVFSKNIWELPDDLTDVLGPQGIKSILIYPLYVSGIYFGFIGFDECTQNRQWPEEETELLRAVSNMLSNAFERQQMTNQVKESELRFKLAISSTEEGLWDWNIQTGEVYFNDLWGRMLGYEPGELENNLATWETLVHPEDSEYVNSEVKKLLEGDQPYYQTAHRLKTKDGGWKWVLDKGTIIERNPDNTPIRAIGMHIDITKQKEAEQELQNLIDTKDKFFSIIAHDLRNPLTILSNFSQLISESIRENKTEDIANYSDILYTVSKNTINLLENLLTWARSQKGELRIDPTINKVNSLVEENISLLYAAAVKKKIRLINSLPYNITAFFDRDAILTVIRNLLTNAIKFTLPGGNIEIGAREYPDKVEIFIKDDGVGIPEEALGKLFQLHHNYSTRGTASEGGSGLGLILCRELIEKNGGKITVKSVHGEGSTFCFTLPKPVVCCMV